MSELRELDAQVASNLFHYALVNAKIAAEKGVIDLSRDGEIGDGGVLPYEYVEGDQFITRYPEDPLRSHVYEIPYYSSSIAAAFQVEDRVAELGLKSEYVQALQGELQSAITWDFVHASPGQRCRAALQCVKEKAKAASS